MGAASLMVPSGHAKSSVFVLVVKVSVVPVADALTVFLHFSLASPEPAPTVKPVGQSFNSVSEVAVREAPPRLYLFAGTVATTTFAAVVEGVEM